jgi:hypothetical protein
MSGRTSIADRLAGLADEWDDLARREALVEDVREGASFLAGLKAGGGTGELVAAALEENDAAAVALLELRRRVLELTEAVKALQVAPRVRYRGTWADDAHYRPGDLVTRSGALWHAWKATTDKPGESSDWQMATKTR